MVKDTIAIVGAGKGGRAILSHLVRLPDVRVKYLIDVNPEAPAFALARRLNIECISNGDLGVLGSDPEVDLILEATGREDIFAELFRIKRHGQPLIGSAGTRIIFHLLEAQDRATQDLKQFKRVLEQRIIERTSEIEEANRRLEEKILEHERLNEKLQQINNEKTRYLLQATHQLKAPFAAIQSYTDIILDGYAGEISPETQDVTEKIKRRCELLATSIREMLELANLKSCITDNLRYERVDLNEVLHAVLEKLKPLALAGKLKVNFRPFAGGSFLQAVKGQMEILFATLLENAVNYSNPGGEIHVDVSGQREGLAIVAVRDQGIGISAEQQKKIFNEYFRANEAVKHHEDGTGLGLAIAREIAHLHNGSIVVQSELGRGSTFTVTLMGGEGARPSGRSECRKAVNSAGQ